MIPARKIAPFNFVVRRWLAGSMRRRFHGVYLFGGEHLRGLTTSAPVIGCVNHTNWWDGFVLYVLSARLLPHDIYLAMDEKNLRRYRFFTWMGVFGIDLSGARAAFPAVRYALRLLVPGRLAWMFVQGKLEPAGVPIEVRPGAVFLARRTHAQILPLILRYEWMQESRPSILISAGAPLADASSAAELARVLNEMHARLDEKVTSLDLAGSELLSGARMSMNKRWDYFRHLVGRRREPFEARNR